MLFTWAQTFIQIHTNGDTWWEHRALMEQTNSIPGAQVPGAAESIRFPEGAQSCRMNNRTSAIHNRVTSRALVSSSQRFTNTATFFRDELHSRVSVSLVSTAFSAHVRAFSVGSKSYNSSYWFFFEKTWWGKAKVLWDMMQVRTNARTVQESHFSIHPPTCWHCTVLFFSPGHEIVQIMRLQILVMKPWLNLNVVWNYLVSFYDFEWFGENSCF